MTQARNALYAHLRIFHSPTAVNHDVIPYATAVTACNEVPYANPANIALQNAVIAKNTESIVIPVGRFIVSLSNAPVQARRRVSADVGWKRWLHMVRSRLPTDHLTEEYACNERGY